MGYSNDQDLVWVVGGIVKETILMNKSLSLCNVTKNRLKKSTHKMGLLQVRKSENRPKTGW